MRSDIIKVCTEEIGVKEDPPSSNKVKYGEWFGLNGYAWCAMFVSWVFDKAGHKLPTINSYKGFSGVQSGYNYWNKKGLLTDTPKEGDIVLFDWNGDGHYDHTGIFICDYKDGKFISIEGNTAVGNDSNGGQVMRRERSYKVAKFVNVDSYIQ